MSMGPTLTADNGSLRLKRLEQEKTNGIPGILAQMKTSSAAGPTSLTLDRPPTPGPITIKQRTALASLQEQFEAGDLIADVAASVLAPTHNANAFAGERSAWKVPTPTSAFVYLPLTPTSTAKNAFEHTHRSAHDDSLVPQAKAHIEYSTLQLARIDENKETFAQIRMAIDKYDALHSAITDEEKDDDFDQEESNLQWSLGSSLKRTTSETLHEDLKDKNLTTISASSLTISFATGGGFTVFRPPVHSPNST
ncbi:hypothetical protein B0H19DRAFT_1245568 [Mycena capillaripes]|nr:hypothetical protein B0H19DRAFT_1245568 [Mycena capillaripes]